MSWINSCMRWIILEPPHSRAKPVILYRIIPGTIYTVISVISEGMVSTLVGCFVLVVGVKLTYHLMIEGECKPPSTLVLLVPPALGGIAVWIILLGLYSTSYLLGLLLMGLIGVIKVVSLGGAISWIIHILLKEREHHFSNKLIRFFMSEGKSE